ncbi:MAG: hypothetical protein J6R07_03185 [Bacteroidaceae bacterium]|nr:hypothetical protein [Bacteroidaceae bacterium]
MTKILYIYGYGGSAQGSTCTMLKRLVPEGCTVESFTDTQSDFSKARREILDYIREHGIDLVVGSSLGAFITLTLNGIPRIVVNPCWFPGEELPKIDVPHEIVRTYAPYDHWVEEYITPEDRSLVHAFFGDRDELFGDKYIGEFLRHYPREQCHRIPSGHHLSEEGAREVVGWIAKNHRAI